LKKDKRAYGKKIRISLRCHRYRRWHCWWGILLSINKVGAKVAVGVSKEFMRKENILS